MKPFIREYESSDLEFVNRILDEAFSVQKNNFDVDNCTELVAEYEGIVCGYLLLTKVLNPVINRYYYLIDYVCVSSPFRGLGIGKELMNKAEEIARSNNAMYLQLTSGYQRLSAHKLYEDCGFVVRNSDIFRKVLE